MKYLTRQGQQLWYLFTRPAIRGYADTLLVHSTMGLIPQTNQRTPECFFRAGRDLGFRDGASGYGLIAPTYLYGFSTYTLVLVCTIH